MGAKSTRAEGSEVHGVPAHKPVAAIMQMLHRSQRHRPDSGLIVAHRGASRYAPENSLAAVELAIAQSADMIEIDVRRTADGVLVVHHDPAIYGVSLGRLRYDAVRAGVPQIATLEELLRAMAGRVRLDLEIKEEGYEDQILEMVEARFPLHDLVVTSFSPQVVMKVRSLAPSIRTGWIVEGLQAEDLLRGFDHTGADWLVVERTCIDAQLLSSVWAYEIPLVVWTVNLWSEIDALLQLPGITALITDVPDVARALSNRHAASVRSDAAPR